MGKCIITRKKRRGEVAGLRQEQRRQISAKHQARKFMAEITRAVRESLAAEQGA